jgi:Mrp family chromosome partitioning ATPase
MAELVDQLEKEWDMVLLDSPPIVAVTDASMISQEIDAMVMVVKAAETDRDAFRRAVKSLTSIKVPLAGVVVNGISRRTSKDTYYYYYQYYQHYYGGYYGYYGKDSEEEVEAEEVS